MIGFARLRKRARERANRASDNFVVMRWAHDATHAVQLAVLRKINEDGTPRFAGMIPCEVFDILDELVAVGQPAYRIDAAEGMPKFDLCHHDRSQIVQRQHFLFRSGTRSPPHHAQGAEAVSLTGNQRHASIETCTGAGESTVRLPCVGQQIRDKQPPTAFRHFIARRIVSRHLRVTDAQS